MFNKNKSKSSITLKIFLEEKLTNFTALGLFLILTFTIPLTNGNLNKVMAMLSAGISYFILLDLVNNEENYDLSAQITKSFLEIFVITFPVWVILNLLMPIKNTIPDLLVLGLWIIFIVLPGIIHVSSLFKKQDNVLSEKKEE